MTLIQALITAILQGVTELFPVSSLGHAVVLPSLFGWHIDQHSPQFLPFLVVLHLGTAAALLLYFWRDWIGLALAMLFIGPRDERRSRQKLLVQIVVATIPAVILGFALEKFFRNLFGAPVAAAAFLILNGCLLFFGERMRQQGGYRRLDTMRWLDALIIGIWQSTALIPGISRSGATMVGGLLRGFHHEDAAHFSFLIATPVILGATVLEVPHLLHEGGSFGPVAWIAGAVAGITAWLSVAFLMHYFKRHDFEALDPFAWYCWTFGAIALGLLLFVL
ncbi:MAG TPA: undecaprenyl-diphosphate phosphatase [Stellaceae bacterium]|jgi:undecaprenyl-diphosphatase|nr:undecaprenyl-diphosphate phosphatase [Stellaceae bacterium]